jgi:outer membrane protein assembly factor BamD (BamD/ComL family)
MNSRLILIARVVFCVSLTFVLCFENSFAQDRIESDKKQENASQCTPQLFASAEFAFTNRIWRGTGKIAEKNLKKIIEVCPSVEIDPNIGAELKIVREENAEHNLFIARYYYEEFQKGGHGLKGSQSRLKQIEIEYPEFSKIDEALFLLGKTYQFERNFEDAESTFNKLIEKFPATVFAYRGQVALQEIQNLKLFYCDLEKLP